MTFQVIPPFRVRIFIEKASARSRALVPTFCAHVYDGGDLSGSVFTNRSQEHSLSFSPRFVSLNLTQLLIG